MSREMDINHNGDHQSDTRHMDAVPPFRASYAKPVQNRVFGAAVPGFGALRLTQAESVPPVCYACAPYSIHNRTACSAIPFVPGFVALRLMRAESPPLSATPVLRLRARSKKVAPNSIASPKNPDGTPRCRRILQTQPARAVPWPNTHLDGPRMLCAVLPS